MFGHELVEFSLVLGMPQAVEERLEFALLFFQPPQGLVAVLVKGTVAARAAVAARTAVAAPGPLLGSSVHPFHPLLHPFHATLPAISAAMCPACHSPTPNQISKNHEAERPEQDKAHDRQPDPGRLADVVQMRCEVHDSPRCECV